MTVSRSQDLNSRPGSCFRSMLRDGVLYGMFLWPIHPLMRYLRAVGSKGPHVQGPEHA